ncbi:hypothetical protein EsH8_V_001190 [Colletotrichum jinshuiense]
MDYMLYHDGNIPTDMVAQNEHSELGSDLCLRSSKPQGLSQGGGKALIRGTIVTKLLELDPGGASQLLEEWKNYTAVCAQTVHLKFDTFSQYADHRYKEAAIPLYFQIMSFATGLFLTDDEAAQVAPVLRPLGMAMALVNDYYSFDKEFASWEKQENSSGDELYNGVAYLMRESHLSIEAARGALKDMIVDLEGEFCRLRDDWLRSSECISDRLKRYVCYAQLTAGGSAYWHANAPRYQACPKTRARDHDGLLSPATDATTTDDSGSTNYSCQSHWTADQVSRLGSISSYGTTPPTAMSPVMEPYNYIKSLPQKGFRTKLALALNVWLQVPQQQMEVINNIISTLHSASLIDWCHVPVIVASHARQGSFYKAMGRYFQVRDDYMNLVSPQYTQTKGFCEDLDECKMSLVMIYTLEVSKIVQRIIQIRSRGCQDRMMDEMKSLVLEEMKKHKAMERTEAVLSLLQTDILEIIRSIEIETGVKNEILRTIVEALKA